MEVAATIAKACTAHLIVLCPYRLINKGYQGDVSSLKLKLEREAKERFQSLRDRIHDMEGLSSEFLCEIGFTADRIQSHVKRKNIDLVIVGQEHTSTFQDLKNFNLQTLITELQIPFVIVPDEVKVGVKA